MKDQRIICKEQFENSGIEYTPINWHIWKRAFDRGLSIASVVNKNSDISNVSNRFICQVLRGDEVIETRISKDESDIDYWIFTFKEVYSKYGNQINYFKGVLTDC